jgi:hypothetical protein
MIWKRILLDTMFCLDSVILISRRNALAVNDFEGIILSKRDECDRKQMYCEILLK